MYRINFTYIPIEPTKHVWRYISIKILIILFLVLVFLAFIKRRRHYWHTQSHRKGCYTSRKGTYSKMSVKETGTIFEDFVVDLLADKRLTLLDRTQDRISSRGVYAESCKNPDLHIKQLYGNGYIDYHLECKYKSHRDSDGNIIFDAYKIARYKKFQHENHRKVFLAVGIGRTPFSPEEFLIVPLDSICGNALPKDVTAFRVSPTPKNLVCYINRYFDTLFSKYN